MASSREKKKISKEGIREMEIELSHFTFKGNKRMDNFTQMSLENLKFFHI